MTQEVSGKTELQNLIPQMWSDDMYDELRNKIIFASIFNRDYEGEISQMGDTVKVNQIVAATGEILTDDKQTFSSEEITVNQYEIVVNKRASAAFEFTSLAQLQSQSFEQEAQEALLHGIRTQLENDIIAALLPSTATPDHDIAPVSAGDLAAVDMAAMRTLFSQAKLPVTNRWFVGDPQYYGDLIQKSAFSSSDFIPAGSPQATGALTNPLYGFTVAEHDLLSADTGYAVHPSALSLVMQQGIRVKISDLHTQKKYGFLLSADMVYGFKLFDNKRIIKISG